MYAANQKETKNCAKQQSKTTVITQTTSTHSTSFSLSVMQTSKVERETSFHDVVFWDMTLCSLVDGTNVSGGCTQARIFLQYVGTHLPDYPEASIYIFTTFKT